MKKKIKDYFTDSHGAIIVEASFIFPIVIFVVFFMIYFGNMMFCRAKIDAYIMQAAVDGANYAADPILNEYSHSKSIATSTRGWETKPYRFLFTGFGRSVAGETGDKTEKKLTSMSNTFFTNVTPQITSFNTKYKNHILTSTFSVEAEYVIKLPAIVFINDGVIARFESKCEVPVNDTAEMIRNVDMTVDYVKQYTSLIENTADKIHDLFTKFKGLERLIK